MDVIALVTYIKQAPKTVIQEEYTLPDGTFDISYLKTVTQDKSLTKSAWNNFLINYKVGYHSIAPSKVSNEVSQELFYKYYKFGKYPNVRTWINELYQKEKKILTRMALFTYVLSCQTT